MLLDRFRAVAMGMLNVIFRKAILERFGVLNGEFYLREVCFEKKYDFACVTSASP